MSPLRRQQSARGPLAARIATVAVCILAGFMVATSAVAARNLDLRAERNTDLVDLVQAEAERNRTLTREVSAARAEIDELSRRARPSGTNEALSRAEAAAGMQALRGQGMTVVLKDAPRSVEPVGVDPDLLVVHQQDIQAVINLLWKAGAEAISLQGQRIVSTTGVKCVGNTVVIHGVPYAPPYVVQGIGDPNKIEATLRNSNFVKAYQKFSAAYQLGWEQRREAVIDMPPYRGALELRYAQPLG